MHRNISKTKINLYVIKSFKKNAQKYETSVVFPWICGGYLWTLHVHWSRENSELFPVL